MLRSYISLSARTLIPRSAYAAARQKPRLFSSSIVKMTSQAPDNATTVTASVAEAAKNAANAGGSEAGSHRDEVTGEMVSKR